MSSEPPLNSRNWSKRERYWCVSPTTGQGYWRYKEFKETLVDARDKTPYQHSKTDPHYLRYHKRKMGIRNGYPLWNAMERGQWKEYYTRIFELVHTDADYQYWIREVNTTERQKIDWDVLDRKIQRSKEYPNGFSHDM